MEEETKSDPPDTQAPVPEVVTDPGPILFDKKPRKPYVMTEKRKIALDKANTIRLKKHEKEVFEARQKQNTISEIRKICEDKLAEFTKSVSSPSVPEPLVETPSKLVIEPIGREKKKKSMETEDSDSSTGPSPAEESKKRRGRKEKKVKIVRPKKKKRKVYVESSSDSSDSEDSSDQESSTEVDSSSSEEEIVPVKKAKRRPVPGRQPKPVRPPMQIARVRPEPVGGSYGLGSLNYRF